MSGPDAEKLEFVARALCQKAGHNPDVLVSVWSELPAIKGRWVIGNVPTQPAWTLWYHEASQALTASEEFDLAEASLT